MKNHLFIILLLLSGWYSSVEAAAIKLENAAIQLDGPYADGAELLIVQAQGEAFIWLTGTVARVGPETQALSVAITLKSSVEVGQMKAELRVGEHDKTFAEKIVIPAGAVASATTEYQLVFSETLNEKTASINKMKFRRTVSFRGLHKDASFVPVTRVGDTREARWSGVANPIAGAPPLPANATLQLDWGKYQFTIPVNPSGLFSAIQQMDDEPPRRGRIRLALGGATAEIPDVDGGLVILGVGDHLETTLSKNIGVAPGSGGRIWLWRENQWTLFERQLEAPMIVFLIDAWRKASTVRGDEAVGVVLASKATPSLIDPEWFATGGEHTRIRRDDEWSRSVQADITSTAIPAAVLWCVGSADAKVRTWRMLADPFAVANEESDAYGEALRKGFSGLVLQLFPAAAAAHPSLHIAIPPPIEAKAPTYLDPNGASARLGVQAVVNALSEPGHNPGAGLSWRVAVPLQRSGTAGREALESGLLAAGLGLHLAAQCDLPRP